MLVELDVRDFAIIDHVRLELAGGFNVLTGETGAGKSILIDAVALILGERADTTAVRAGADRALVQGVFDTSGAEAGLASVLADYGIELDGDLLIDREIHAAGRSTARVMGRVVPVKALVEIGQRLVDIHGQTQTASLLREAEHLELLDRFAGCGALRWKVAEAAGALAAVTSELAGLRRDEAETARRVDTLEYQLQEISAARLSGAEEDELLAERVRLVNAERLASLADRAYEALHGRGAEVHGAVDELDVALTALEDLARIDASVMPTVEALREAQATAADAAVSVREYRDGFEMRPERLEEVEDRLAAIADLKRKYGGSVADVLAYAERARSELAAISGAEGRIADLERRRERLVADLGAAAGELSGERRRAADRLAPAVEAEMDALGMPGSRFEVVLAQTADVDGVPFDGARWAVTATGIDRVSFAVSTNPGEPLRPLVKVASGGETARLMLALKSALSAADPVPTLIFDEIDAGIGGRMGAVVGRKLAALAARHQVLCVTHLAQVAAYADVHLNVKKAVAEGRTVTEVARISGDDQVEELTHMLGTPTSVGRENARQLVATAEAWKADRQEVTAEAT